MTDAKGGITREDKLQKALDLALAILVRFEPGDSRAVSDEFVAMASVAAGNENDACLEIIARAMERLEIHD